MLEHADLIHYLSLGQNVICKLTIEDYLCHLIIECHSLRRILGMSIEEEPHRAENFEFFFY